MIQPTHLSSATLSLDPDTPGAPMYWRSRAEGMRRILDRLEALVRNRLERLRYRPDTLGGFIAGTGLTLAAPTSP